MAAPDSRRRPPRGWSGETCRQVRRPRWPRPRSSARGQSSSPVRSSPTGAWRAPPAHRRPIRELRAKIWKFKFFFVQFLSDFMAGSSCHVIKLSRDLVNYGSAYLAKYGLLKVKYRPKFKSTENWTKSESGLTAQPEEESHCVESSEQLAQVQQQSTDKT